MKLYHFNPNDYGREYFVMSKDKSCALNSLKDYLKETIKTLAQEGHDIGFYKDKYKLWKKATLENLPKGYVLEEYGENQVVNTEIS